MSWATAAIVGLRNGEQVIVRPRGNSMRPRIESGALCQLAPITPAEPLEAGDVVLCRVHGRYYLHVIKAASGERYLIGNQRGRINGWVGRGSIYGRLVQVNGRVA